MPKNQKDTDKTTPALGDVTKAIVNFSNSSEYCKLDAFYRQKSMFEILGIHRNETRHSRFLAWLLNPTESHGLLTFGLKKFFEVCLLSSLESEQKISDEQLTTLLENLVVGQVEIIDVTTQTELPLGKKSRIDIVVYATVQVSPHTRKNVAVLIENKVKSKEHSAQTSQYYEWFKTHKVGYDYVLCVYLTPISTLLLNKKNMPDCECKDFLQINYQYLADYLIEPAHSLVQSEQAKMFIADYLRALSISSVIVAENKDNKGDIVMAISERERVLLSKFWEKHQSLILAAFYAFSNDPDKTEEERDFASQVIQSLGAKDYSPYSVFLDGKLVAKKVTKTNIGLEVVKVLIKANISDEKFQTLKKNKSSSFMLLKQRGEISENEKHYNRYRVDRVVPITFNGDEYYVSSSWGENNIPKFQSFLQKHFPNVSIEKETLVEK